MALREDLEKMKTLTGASNFLIRTGRAKNRREAERIIWETIPVESHYQRKIIDYLKRTYPSAFVWKAAAGPYSQGGIPDVCAIICGTFWGFEVKRPLVGKLSPLQTDTIRRINEAGGNAVVVCTVADVRRAMEG